MANRLAPFSYSPETAAPLRHDAPGTIMEMPSANRIYHIHFFADEHTDEAVEFCITLLNAEIVGTRPLWRDSAWRPAGGGVVKVTKGKRTKSRLTSPVFCLQPLAVSI